MDRLVSYLLDLYFSCIVYFVSFKYLFSYLLFMSINFSVSSNDLKSLKNTIENMFLEKVKVEKGDKTKKKGGKGKAKLKVEGENVSKIFLYIFMHRI